ncbi:glycosyltransferase family 4 protein [Kiritimatiella glycovorans]|uniref:Putative glycosyltransferase n=1 Tax=Kiritimatiella glycovorans TaxID=1307763 RepID=A0A0G3EGG9_9BACT|nr:glycosyltransferase family 1 protein [Kiritimatiella glycovorans]AKJ63880.1 putative glycosyltransferase [Kiritimatiella glycovorans]
MRVLVDAREFVPGRITGIGRYLLNILLPLKDQGDAPECILAGDPAAMPPELAGPRFRRVAVPVRQTQLADQWGLPHLARRWEADIFFSPYYKAPLRCPASVVLSVPDVAFLHLPDGPRGLKRALVKAQLRASLRRAVRVIAISDCTRRDLISFEPSAAGKITVVYNDYPAAWDRPLPGGSPVDRPFMLYVGTFKPYKHVDTLVRACGLLRERFRERRWKLVLVGGAPPEERAKIEALIREKGLEDLVELRSGLPDDELRRHYAHARWFVTASGYEGFGLPLLEAMAAGCPAVYHRAASMPEVVGDTGIAFDDPSPQTAAEAMARAMDEDEAGRDALGRRARERAERKFAPGSCAAGTWDVIRDAVGGGGG